MNSEFLNNGRPNSAEESRVCVSVIVPVYNSEQYLPESIICLLQEPFDNFEILLVDDGSTDASGKLCDEFASKDSRVRVIHKQNGGMCQARNVGIKEACGEYIAFADNDDKVLSGFIKDNYELAKQYNADCVRFGRRMIRYDANGKLRATRDAVPREIKVLTAPEIIKNFSEICYGTGAVWSGLYKREFILDNNLVFNEAFRHGHEDTLFNAQAVLVANTYVLNPKLYYLWIRRESHSSSMVFEDNWFEAASAVLTKEFEIYQRADLLKTNPKWCAKRIISIAMDPIVSPFYTTGVTYQGQLKNFEKSRSLIMSYKDFLDTCQISSYYEVIKRLLLAKRYRCLYCFVRAGLLIKNVSRGALHQ